MSALLYLDFKSARSFRLSKENLVQSQDISLDKEKEISYESIANSVDGCKELILVGPDQEKVSFRKWLLKHHQDLNKKLIAIVNVPEVDDKMLQSFRVKYFR